MFWSKPCSLALPKDSPLRIDEPDYVGIRRFILKLMMFYSKQSMSIRGANVIYKRIIAQVDKPAIYDGTFFGFQHNFCKQNYVFTFCALFIYWVLCVCCSFQLGENIQNNVFAACPSYVACFTPLEGRWTGRC